MTNLKELYYKLDTIIEELILEPFNTSKHTKFLQNISSNFTTLISVYAKKNNKYGYVVTKSINTPFANQWLLPKGKVTLKFKQLENTLITDGLQIFLITKPHIENIFVENNKDDIKIEFYIRKTYCSMTSVELSYYYHTIQFSSMVSPILDVLEKNRLDFELSPIEFRTFIRKYQCKLQGLKQQIATLQSKSYGITWEKYQIIYNGIDSIMEYLHDKHLDFLDPTYPLPRKSRASFLNQYQTQCDRLIHLILETNCPQVIRDTILDIIDSMRLKDFTVTKTLYFKKFFETFGTIFQFHDQYNKNSWYIFSIAANLNTEEIYTEIVKNWIECSQNKQYTSLSELQDKIKSIVSLKDDSFDPTRMSLQKQLIQYFESKIDTTDYRPSANRYIYPELVQKIHSNTKIETTLTVEEFALGLRLCFDNNLLKGAKHYCFQESPKAISANGNKEFSSSNIKKHYYSFSRKSLDSLEQYLIKLINTIQKFRSDANS